MMFFASDNGGPVHPRIMEALARANDGYAMPYGADALMEQVRARLRAAFEAPEAEIFLLTSGTAANALILASLVRPYETILCSPDAHVFDDECGAPEFYTGGARLAPIAAEAGRIRPEALAARLASRSRDVHQGRDGALSLTNLTEAGTLYSADEIARLAGIAHDHGLAVHLDGARLANALVASGASLADMTWRAGVDAVSFGATKNGAMGVEAAVFFKRGGTAQWARDFAFRRMRGGHLLSKHRYLSAQMAAYLEGDLWLELAGHANAMNRELVSGLAGLEGVELLHPAPGNIAFARFSRARHQRLLAAGARYYVMDGDPQHGAPDEMLTARLVCGWSTTPDSVQRLLAAF